ncbi:MAG: hypothetical protein ACXWWD_12065, partial [Chitinophagaceae bacterium]
VFSQEVVKNSEYYYAKSKRQKSGAKVMLIGGSVLLGTGIILGNRKEASFGDGVVLGGIGALLMIGSIPVFGGSAKNKRKAASLSFNNMMTPQIKNSSLVHRPTPAVSLKISLQ